MQNFVTPNTHTKTLGHVNLSLFFFVLFSPFPNNFFTKDAKFQWVAETKIRKRIQRSSNL
jgi:hypothetical protein